MLIISMLDKKKNNNKLKVCDFNHNIQLQSDLQTTFRYFPIIYTLPSLDDCLQCTVIYHNDILKIYHVARL